MRYEGSIGIDENLIDAAGFVPFEAVQIWNITAGARLETYVIPERRGSGGVIVNEAAAARLVHSGDRIIISSFAWMDEGDIPQHVLGWSQGGRNGREATRFLQLNSFEFLVDSDLELMDRS